MWASRHTETTFSAVDLEAVAQWFRSELGRELLAAEEQLVGDLVVPVCGYHMLQVSIGGSCDLLGRASGGHKFTLVPPQVLDKSMASVSGEPLALPFANDCIDLVVLHHALDFTQSPHQVLREASRVLRAGGKLVVVGFNPLGLWGLRRLLRRGDRPPWNGRFLPVGRLQDWLTLLELKPERVCSGFFRPPLQSPRWRRRLAPMEGWSPVQGAVLGAFVAILASKEAFAGTPIGQSWRRRLMFPVPRPARSHSGRQAARVLQRVLHRYPATRDNRSSSHKLK